MNIILGFLLFFGLFAGIYYLLNRMQEQDRSYGGESDPNRDDAISHDDFNR